MSKTTAGHYFTVRPLERDKDSEGVLDLYNHYVRMSHATFDVRPSTLDEKESWFQQFDASDGSLHCIVASGEKGEIAGYACSVPWRDKEAYGRSVEVSIYLREHFTGLGLGKRLYGKLFETLARTRAHRAYALIALPNPASVKLHKAHGFRDVGTWHETGYKFDRYWDVGVYEKRL